MAIYKPAYCSPFLTGFDVNDKPQYIECKIETSNTNITAYSLTIYDNNNNIIAGGGKTANDVTLLSDIRQMSIDNSNHYPNLNSGLNGSYLRLPLLLSEAPTSDTVLKNLFYPTWRGEGEVELTNSASYKWSITLYQGVLEQNDTPVLPTETKDFDMILTKGTVMGSTNERIQSKNSYNILQDYYVQPVHIDNLVDQMTDNWKIYGYQSTDKLSDYVHPIGNRARIKNYDSGFGYIIPQTGTEGLSSDVIDAQKSLTNSGANGFQVFKHSNKPEILTTADKVQGVISTTIDHWDWYPNFNTPGASYGEQEVWINSEVSPNTSWGGNAYLQFTNNAKTPYMQTIRELQGFGKASASSVTKKAQLQEWYVYNIDKTFDWAVSTCVYTVNGVIYKPDVIQTTYDGPGSFTVKMLRHEDNTGTYNWCFNIVVGYIQGKTSIYVAQKVNYSGGVIKLPENWDPVKVNLEVNIPEDETEVDVGYPLLGKIIIDKTGQWSATHRNAERSAVDLQILQASQSSVEDKIYIAPAQITNGISLPINGRLVISNTTAMTPSPQYNGIYTIEYSKTDDSGWVTIGDDYQEHVFCNKYTIKYTRAPDADTWGELINKIVYNENETGKLFARQNIQATTPASAGDIPYGTINETPVEFVPEIPVDIYTDKQYPDINTETYKKQLGIIYYNYQMGKLPIITNNWVELKDLQFGANANFSAQFRVKASAVIEGEQDILQFYNTGDQSVAYRLSYNSNDGFIIKKSSGGAQIIVKECGDNVLLQNKTLIRWDLDIYSNSYQGAEMNGDPNGYLHIRPFNGIEQSMRWYETNISSPRHIDIDAIDTDRWMIKYSTIDYENGRASDTNPPLLIGETQYQIRSFFRTSDENPFTCYAAPNIGIYTYNNESNYIEGIPSVLSQINAPYVWARLSYGQDNNIQWKRCKWTVYYSETPMGEYKQVYQTNNNYEQIPGLKLDGLVRSGYYRIQVEVVNQVGYTTILSTQSIQSNIISQSPTRTNIVTYDCATRTNVMDISTESQSGQFTDVYVEEDGLATRIQRYDYSRPISQLVYRDFNVAAGHKYNYYFGRPSGSGYVMYKVESEVVPYTTGWTLTELYPTDVPNQYLANPGQVWIFKYTQDEHGQTQNMVKNVQETMGKYPRVVHGVKNYMTGNASCYLGRDIINSVWYKEHLGEGYPFVNKITNNDAVNMINEWKEICYSGNPKLLRDQKGQRFLVEITENEIQVHEMWGTMPTSINFSWVEIGNADNIVVSSIPSGLVGAAWNGKNNMISLSPYSGRTFNIQFYNNNIQHNQIIIQGGGSPDSPSFALYYDNDYPTPAATGNSSGTTWTQNSYKHLLFIGGEDENNAELIEMLRNLGDFE